MSKISKFVVLITCVLSSFKCTKTRFDRGCAPDPARGAYDVLPSPLLGCGGASPFHILPLDVFSVSICMYRSLSSPKPSQPRIDDHADERLIFSAFSGTFLCPSVDRLSILSEEDSSKPKPVVVNFGANVLRKMLPLSRPCSVGKPSAASAAGIPSVCYRR